MKLSLKQALISAVVVLTGVSLLMPTASVFAVAAPVQTAPVTSPKPTTQTTTATPVTPTAQPTTTPATTTTAPTTTTTAQSSRTKSTTTTTDSVTSTRCEGGVLGWILCPVVKLGQDFVKQLEDWIVNRLDMGPLQNTGRYENLYKAWSGFRDLANVFFIGIFMAIIFAQTLSIGLDNYSIKLMLPRLIIAAIAIQFSFFLMQIGVDIANVLGNGIAGVFNSMIRAGSSGGEAYTSAQALGTLTAVGVTAGIAAGATITTGLIVPALLLVLAAAISLLGVVITVWLRVLVLQILVILAPLAIVAWVLPNTEIWYKKWISNVVRLLLMYPLIQFLISAGALATHISAITAEQGDFAKMLGALIPILIFFMIPATIKASGSIMNATGSFVMGRMNSYGRAVRGSTLMQDAKTDLKERSYRQYADNDLSELSGFGKKAKAGTRRGMGRIVSGNTLSFQRFGDAGTRKMTRGVQHARHALEEDWKTFFSDNAFGNPELLKIAQAGLVDHETGEFKVTNSYGREYKFKMNHHLAEAAVSQMVQQQGMVELSELVDGKKNADGTLRDPSRGLFDHATNQWKNKDVQMTMLRAIGPNAGTVINKITHAIHLQGDKAYGELSGSGFANLGAGSGITAATEAVKWNRANALSAMLTVVNSGALSGSIQNDVAKSLKRELLKADAEGKFTGVTINAQNQDWTVQQFLDTFITAEGQVQTIQGDIKRTGLDDILEAVKLEQQQLQAEIDRAREDRLHGGGGH